MKRRRYWRDSSYKNATSARSSLVRGAKLQLTTSPVAICNTQ